MSYLYELWYYMTFVALRSNKVLGNPKFQQVLVALLPSVSTLKAMRYIFENRILTFYIFSNEEISDVRRLKSFFLLGRMCFDISDLCVAHYSTTRLHHPPSTPCFRTDIVDLKLKVTVLNNENGPTN